jgi:signal transduction histidine kinase
MLELRRHQTLAIVFAVLVAATVAILAIPALQLGVTWSAIRVPLSTASAVIALLATGLAYLWYSLTGQRSAMFIGVAFLVLSANQFIVGVLLLPRIIDDPALYDRFASVYFWTGGRFIAAVVLILGARERIQDRPPVRSPAKSFITLSIVAVGALVLLDAGLWAIRDHLPSLCCPSATGQAWFSGLTVIGIVLGISGTGLLLVAAYLFRSDGRSTQIPHGDWLSLVLVLLAFSHLHYLLAPIALSQRVPNGDLLRIAQYVVLFLGLLWEMRLILIQEREHSDELATMGAMRNEMSKIVTHDLIHAVATLRTFAVGLHDRWGEIPETDRMRIAERIDLQSQHLGTLAKGIVAALALAPDTMRTSMRPQPVTGIVRDAAEIAGGLEPGVDVRMEPGADDVDVLADPDGLLRVLTNLIWNAERHGKSSGNQPIELAVRRSDRGVVISVRDHGSGISPGDMGGLFEPRTHHRNGADSRSGIGLRASRAIVQAHGGYIWAESSPGRGSTFSVSLPRWEGSDA